MGVCNTMDAKNQDFYQKIRYQIKTWAKNKSSMNSRWFDIIILAPDFFHLLSKLMLDKDVPLAKKAKLAGVIAYFISPLDVIPEAIFGPVGYLDDIALAAYVLNELINEVDPRVITRHWAGEREVINLIKTILANSDKMFGSGLWKKIRRKIR
ncbi:MAG: DUF1232 domain-containing protein [bacterium]|nr:MAG: DUF1232 domain-containing protein [bacterium]